MASLSGGRGLVAGGGRRVNTERKKKPSGDGVQFKTQIATCGRYSPLASA